MILHVLFDINNKNKKVLIHDTFSILGKRLTGQIESLCKNFKNIDDRDKLLYILTYENECIINVGKFLNLIISSQRPNFSKIWKAVSEHVN